MPPIRLLLIQANPPDGIALAIDVEQRNLQDALLQSAVGRDFEIRALPASRIGDIPRYLRAHAPHLVHFACHGDGNGGLQLNAPGDRNGEVLSAEQLAAVVRDYQEEAREPLRVIVLAGCWTDETARLVAQHVDCAVGFDGNVADSHLLDVFTPQFYGALGDARTVPNSVEAACSVLRGRGLDETADMVRCYPRPGVDVSQTRVTNWTPTVLSLAHMDYLKMWFNKPWADVSLADILGQDGGEERVPLLDIYVPLPVDFSLVVMVQAGEVVDWWTVAEQTRRAVASDLLKATGHEFELQTLYRDPQLRQRDWPVLGVTESELQQIVDVIQVKMDERRVAGEATEDGEHTWCMEAHHAASIQPRFVLLGEPGSGKSSFLRHLTLCLGGELRRRAGDHTAPTNAGLTALRDWLLDAYTPIYVELRELVSTVFPPLPANAHAELRMPEVEDFWRHVGSLGGGHLAEPGGELRKLCGDGRAILLLDGLDEVPQADSLGRRRQIQGLVAALGRAYPNLRTIVASRPHAYYSGGWALDGFGVGELRPLVIDRLSELAHALFRAVLGAIGSEQVGSFITAVEERLKDRRIEVSFYANPLFFTLLAGLWLDPRNGRQLPETRPELYRRAVDLLLSRWTRRRLADSSLAENLGLTPDRLRSVLETLACNVHERSAPGEDTTLFPVKELLGVLYDAGCEVKVRDIPDYLSQHTGLLTAPQYGWLYFTHRSFQEHLAACELVCREPHAHLPPVAKGRRFPGGLVQRTLGQPDLWENVARLAAGELVVQGRMRELGSFLAACLRPYLERGHTPMVAVLALEISRDHGLFAADPEDLEIRGSEYKLLRESALQVLVDWERIEPQQRNTAGEALGARLEHDNRRGVGLRPDGLPDIDWVEVPEADKQGRREFIFQKDARRVEPTFWMARYPVTYAQYQAFLDAEDGYQAARWWEGLDATIDARLALAEQRFRFWNHPRENVTWYAAIAFCRWLTWQAKERRDLLPQSLTPAGEWRINLPTELQWEKAARGHDGRLYPWDRGEYRDGYANVSATQNPGEGKTPNKYGMLKTSAVGLYPQGASPYGICDLSGNVWEWCLNEYHKPERVQEAGAWPRALRGGSWYHPSALAATVARDRRRPNFWFNLIGFRVVCSLPRH